MAYSKYKEMSHLNLVFDLNSFNVFDDMEKTSSLIVETLYMTDYSFKKYKTGPKTKDKKNIYLLNSGIKKEVQQLKEGVLKGSIISEGINFCRDLVNGPPNVLYPESLAKIIVADVKKNLKGVKVSVLNKTQIKKRK